ncbi:hypothetical protein ACFSVJ_20725 [Prauserella oleivorans]
MSARATEPPRFDDWRTRMAVRGGPVTHAVARAGWAAFGIVGALLMVGVAVLWTLNPTAEGSDNAPAANFVGGLVVFVPIGALVAGAIGLGAQFLARAWLRTPTDAERTAAREAATPLRTPDGCARPAGGRGRSTGAPGRSRRSTRSSPHSRQVRDATGSPASVPRWTRSCGRRCGSPNSARAWPRTAAT